MAITFDAAGSVNVSTAMGTISHTCSSQPNRLLWCYFAFNGAATITAVTYAGSNMTQAATQDFSNTHSYLYYLANPKNGANNLIISLNSTPDSVLRGVSSSYYGAKITGIPDASTTGSQSSVGTFSLSVTSVADNCWHVMGADGPNVQGAGASTTKRADGTAIAFYDSNSSKTPPGAVTLAGTGGPDNWMGIAASFAPALTDSYLGKYR